MNNDDQSRRASQKPQPSKEQQRRAWMRRDVELNEALTKAGKPLPSIPVLRTTMWSVVMLLESFHEGLYHGKMTHELQQHAGKLAALLEFDLKGMFGKDPLSQCVGLLMTVREHVPHKHADYGDRSLCAEVNAMEMRHKCPACLLDRFFSTEEKTKGEEQNG